VVILEIGSCFLLWPTWTIIFLFYASIAGMTGAYYLLSFFSVEVGSCELFAQASLNLSSSNLSLLIAWDDKLDTSIWLFRCVLLT
jgi:hypothetical protein